MTLPKRRTTRRRNDVESRANGNWGVLWLVAQFKILRARSLAPLVRARVLRMTPFNRKCNRRQWVLARMQRTATNCRLPFPEPPASDNSFGNKNISACQVMSTSPGFGRLVSFPLASRRDRWYERMMSAHLAQSKGSMPAPKLAVNWDKMLGMATLLLVSGVGWTAVGVAASFFLR